jgi:hypothetical protein
VNFIKEKKINPTEDQTLQFVKFPEAVHLFLCNQDESQKIASSEKHCEILPDFRAELKKILKTGKYSDVTFEISGQLIPVHRAILSPQWQFFSTILLRSAKKNSEPGSPETISVDSGIPRDSFVRLLSYFYGRKVSSSDLPFVHAHWFLAFADYYDLKFCPNFAPLLKISERVVRKRLTREDVIPALQLSFELGSADLEKNARDTLAERFTAAELADMLVETLKNQQKKIK